MKEMNEYLFTYWNGISKAMLIIEASTLALALNKFMLEKISVGLNEAISFQVKKVVS